MVYDKGRVRLSVILSSGILSSGNWHFVRDSSVHTKYELAALDHGARIYFSISNAHIFFIGLITDLIFNIS